LRKKISIMLITVNFLGDFDEQINKPIGVSYLFSFTNGKKLIFSNKSN